MKPMAALLCVAVVASGGGVVAATDVESSSGPGRILRVFVGKGPVALVVPETRGPNRPDCVNGLNRFALDLTTDAGRAQHATVLAAMLSGAQVKLVGEGVCLLAGNVGAEDLRYLYVTN